MDELIRQALAGDPAMAGFGVRYQPIVQLDDASVVGVQALAHHSLARRAAQKTFVAAAGALGRPDLLDDFVLEQACNDAKALAAACDGPVSLHVSISARRLEAPTLQTTLEAALRQHRMPASCLVLEISESNRIQDMRAAAAAMAHLKNLGMRVALDAVGARFDLTPQLRGLPVDAIRLDAMLLSADAEAPKTKRQTWSRHVLTLCREMSVVIIADGIETTSHAQALRGIAAFWERGTCTGPQRHWASWLLIAIECCVQFVWRKGTCAIA
jgi:EAL domain-containing protein (putative c-di-GMP-specific phosphodiesterase class I)